MRSATYRLFQAVFSNSPEKTTISRSISIRLKRCIPAHPLLHAGRLVSRFQKSSVMNSARTLSADPPSLSFAASTFTATMSLLLLPCCYYCSYWDCRCYSCCCGCRCCCRWCCCCGWPMLMVVDGADIDGKQAEFDTSPLLSHRLHVLWS